MAADEMPIELRRELKPRPGPVLGSGPFALPISTLDWLVSRESPAARFVCLRDLLERPDKDIDLRKARQGVPRDPFLRDALPMLRQALGPGVSRLGADAPADSGTVLAAMFAEMGADTSLPEIKHAVDVFLARWEIVFVAIERGEEPSAGPAFLSSCRTLCRLGLGTDPRIVHAAENVAGRVVASSQPEADVSPALAFLTALPQSVRSGRIQRGIDFAVERVLALELPPAGTGPWDPARERFGFPGDARVDLLSSLAALADAAVPESPVITEALTRLARRADHRGRWKLDRPLPVRLSLPFEREGELSRWVSLRALRVLSRFRGLALGGTTP